MLAFHGRGELDLFVWHLARELGRTVAEIEEMSHAEYAGWASYFTARHAMQSVLGGGT